MAKNKDDLRMPGKDKFTYLPKEIQNILGVSHNTMYKLIRDKKFHSVVIGKDYRISKKSFDKWFFKYTNEKEKSNMRRRKRHN